MRVRLITDFDGPIVDVSLRYYNVYCFCLEATQQEGQQIKRLTKSEFWEMKRARIPETEIGRRSGLSVAQAKAFAHLRHETVHTMPYFDDDTLAPGAVATLERLQEQGIDLTVMTMRRERELDYALKQYNLAHFFPHDRRYCLGNDYVKTKDIKDKPLLMERALAELPSTEVLWMVGDTEADIMAAKIHGVTSIAVLCGIRDRTQLERYEPDFIVPNLAAAVDLVLQEQYALPSSS